MPLSTLGQSIAPLADTQRKLSKVFAQSIAPLADTQRKLSKVFAQSIALPDLGFVVSQNNAMISSAIENNSGCIFRAPHKSTGL